MSATVERGCLRNKRASSEIEGCPIHLRVWHETTPHPLCHRRSIMFYTRSPCASKTSVSSTYVM
jgi:hypothetical protein